MPKSKTKRKTGRTVGRAKAIPYPPATASDPIKPPAQLPVITNQPLGATSWKWTKRIGALFGVVLPIVWLKVEPGLEPLIASIAGLVLAITTVKLDAKKHNILDKLTAVALGVFCVIPLTFIIRARSHRVELPVVKLILPEEVVPVLNFTHGKQFNEFHVTPLQSDARLERGRIHYPTVVPVVFEEVISQPDLRWQPSHLQVFLTKLYETIPAPEGLTITVSRSGFPFGLTTDYAIHGERKTYVGLYIVDYSWSKHNNKVAMAFDGVRLVKSVALNQDFQEELDALAVEGLNKSMSSVIKGLSVSASTKQTELTFSYGNKTTVIDVSELLKEQDKGSKAP